jgi:hypothetical protein
MKKLLVICFALVSTQSFSQSLFQRLSFGLKAGANYSNYTNANFNTEGMVGFHAGGLVNFKLTNSLSIQEEFLFSTQGAKVKDNVFGTENIKVSYINVPFLLKYRSNLGLYIEAGPQVGMRANDNVSSTQIGEFAKKLDLSAVGGIGFQSKSGFGFGARYIAGLSKVGDFQPSTVKPDFRNSVIQASIFYIF